jgi:hypothetical protein
MVGKKGTDSTYWGHDESRSGNDLDDQRSVPSEPVWTHRSRVGRDLPLMTDGRF